MGVLVVTDYGVCRSVADGRFRFLFVILFRNITYESVWLIGSVCCSLFHVGGVWC